MKRNENISSEEAMKQVQKMFKERGTKAIEIARREILKEKVECKEAREALHYFMTQYWHDLARPALLSLCCEAVGGDPKLTTPLAVPMTLISGAIDIHDDILDQSKRKNGRPTVYGKFGKEVALLVGDALMFKGFNLLYKAGNEILNGKMSKIIDIIHNTFFLLGDAEALELQFRSRLDITPEEYMYVAKKKAANVEAHTSIGAIIGGGTNAEVKALGNYGLALGTMLVIQDDVMDMLDSEEFLHRIRYECPPLPVLCALKNPEIKKKFQSFLKEKITKQNAKLLLKIVSETEEVKDLEESIQDLAERCYSQIKHVKRVRDDLKLITRTLLQTAKLKRD